jgi:hypothetical protein
VLSNARVALALARFANLEDTPMSAHRTGTEATVGRQAANVSASPLGWIMITAALAAAVVGLAAALPTPLVLPALSILLVTVGFVSAAALYLAGHRLTTDRHPGWELAGVLIFLGFAAGMMSDTQDALAVLDRMIGPATASAQ